MLTLLQNYVTRQTKSYPPQYVAYGLFGMGNALFYYLWWHYVSPEHYESLLLRAICFLLCLLLVIHPYWPKCCKPYRPLYWYGTLLLTLPFFFAFSLTMNHGSTMWITNTVVMVFFTLLLVNFISAVTLLVVGTLLGIITAIGLQLEIYHLPWSMIFPNDFNYRSVLLTYAIALLIGAIFARNREALEKLTRESIRIQTESEEKTEFIANMSHDLRTPLSGLLSLAELEANQLPDGHPVKPSLTIIHQSAKQLHQLFEAILETTKLTYRLQLDEPTPFSIDQLIEQVMVLFKPTLMAKSLHCQTRCFSSKPLPQLNGHPRLIEKVLMNLVSNAIKFTDPEDTITIEYGFCSHSSRLKLVVTDNGQGIAKSDQAIIFKSFKRLHPAYKHSHYMGTGLGLYTVKKLLELMEGHIKVISQGINQGSQFVCWIPATVATTCLAEETISPPVDSDSPSEISFSLIETNGQPLAKSLATSPRILLVEDIAFVRLTEVKLLQQMVPDCHIDQANSMTAAIKQACHTRYDLILMDVGLPDGCGREAAQRIRQSEASRNRTTPIIAVTAHTDDQLGKAACLSVGMQAVLYKPLTPTAIKKLFEDYIDAAQPNLTHEDNS